MTERNRLAVLGSPIAHSQSPALHSAAYRVLGLDWSYGALRVDSGELGSFLQGLDDDWRGLSLTMPLKREVLPLLDSVDDATTLVGAANTVLFQNDRKLGFNTDVFGVTAALAEQGITSVKDAIIVGAGATSGSVLAALAGLGLRTVTVLTRSPSKAIALETLASTLRVGFTVNGFTVNGFTENGFEATPVEGRDELDLVISTLPGDTPLVQEFTKDLRAATPLVDIAYDPWPTQIAAHWSAVGGATSSGLAMLIHQALAQVRIFTSGDPQIRLDNEDAVLAAMRVAVGVTPTTS